MCLLTSLLLLLLLHQITSVAAVLSPVEMAILQQAGLPPVLYAALSVGWIALGLASLGQLRRRTADATRWASSTLIGFAAYSLLRLLLGARADYDRGRAGLWGLLLAILGIMGAALWWRARRSETRDAYGDTEN